MQQHALGKARGCAATVNVRTQEALEVLAICLYACGLFLGDGNTHEHAVAPLVRQRNGVARLVGFGRILNLAWCRTSNNNNNNNNIIIIIIVVVIIIII